MLIRKKNVISFNYTIAVVQITTIAMDVTIIKWNFNLITYKLDQSKILNPLEVTIF